MNLVIVGMRGAGKSNVSRRLALISKRPALSTDDLVRYETGQSIPDFVQQEGWSAFRDVEYQVLQKLLAMESAIVDCGGTSVRTNIVNIEASADHVKLGMPVKLTTFPIGKDEEGVEAINFGFEPAA